MEPLPADLRIAPISQEDFAEAGELLLLLNPKVGIDDLLCRLEEMHANHAHYTCLGAWTDGRLVALAGYWIGTKLWCGRYIEADNVITHHDYRGRGVGHALMQRIEQIGRAEQCQIAVLDAYTSNRGAHRLYHKLGYEIYGFHFVKPLADDVPDDR